MQSQSTMVEHRNNCYIFEHKPNLRGPEVTEEEWWVEVEASLSIATQVSWWLAEGMGSQNIFEASTICYNTSEIGQHLIIIQILGAQLRRKNGELKQKQDQPKLPITVLDFFEV